MTLPSVDVVVPVYGRSNLVLRLIDSLRGQKRLGDIIIINDHSPESETTVFKTIEGVRYFENSGNDGFVKSSRRGAAKATNDYLLFLNSDTEALHPHCIERMAENLDDGAAIVGALLIYPKDDPYRPERIQHAGVAIGVDSYPYHILSGMHVQTPAAQVKRRVTAVTGACFMIKREWWDRIGGFDPKFGKGVFEDVSACLTVKKLGGEIIYEPLSVWVHREHQSQPASGGWFTREHLHENFTYLLAKHGTIECDDKLWYKGV